MPLEMNPNLVYEQHGNKLYLEVISKGKVIAKGSYEIRPDKAASKGTVRKLARELMGQVPVSRQRSLFCL